ncbi:MAG: PTS sugar transporter subunit IIC/EAL domain-containing protein [Selenomonadaceae bacterium]|nr:PTS sugar transporter subunit IIC/EAL domain-containing protein [Selenomonadaceae bacterium]
MKDFLFRLTDRMEESWIVRSISRSLLLLLPVIFLSVVFSLITHLPVGSWQIWLYSPDGEPVQRIGFLLSHGTLSVFAVLFAAAVGWNFARERNMPPYQTILMPSMSIIGFIILVNGNYTYFSPRGLFSAVIASILTCSLYSALSPFIRQKIKENDLLIFRDMHSLPKLEDVLFSFIPLTVVLLLVTLLQEIITGVLHMPLQEYVNREASLLVMSLSDHPMAVDAVIQIICHLLWFFGINGTALTDNAIADFYHESFRQDIFLGSVESSFGSILNPGFHNAFLQIGGCGSGLALILAVLFISRYHSMRTAAKMSLLPAFFNVGELTICSLPLVCNPIYLLPFIFVPLINLYPTAFATDMGMLPAMIERLHPNTPVFINAYLGSHSLYASLVQLGLLVLDVLIYLPFVKLDEQRKRHKFAQKVRELEKFCQLKEDLKERWLSTDLTEKQSILMAELGNDLKTALQDKNGLFMVYQPQTDQNEANIGAEALIRWKHPVAGFIYPPLIITIARMSGQMRELEKFIFSESAMAAAKIEETLGKDAAFKISVNITGDALEDDELEYIIAAALLQAGIAEKRIWIEVTEQDAITLSVETMDRLERLKEKGHKLVIDDFGMGHTSIRYLQWGIFDVVKLDGSITRSALEDERAQQIIASLTSLSEQMNMVSVAEYVDNVPQRNKLQELGCDIFQGYLYSKPLELNDLVKHFKA